jgi:hypothetical protein
MEQEEAKERCCQCSCEMEENLEETEDFTLDMSKMTAEERSEYLYRLFRSRSWGS